MCCSRISRSHIRSGQTHKGRFSYIYESCKLKVGGKEDSGFMDMDRLQMLFYDNNVWLKTCHTQSKESVSSPGASQPGESLLVSMLVVM